MASVYTLIFNDPEGMQGAWPADCLFGMKLRDLRCAAATCADWTCYLPRARPLTAVWHLWLFVLAGLSLGLSPQ